MPEKMPSTAAADPPAQLSVNFTRREMSILNLVALGFTNVQIGENLHISKYTVAQHIAMMLRRIGAANRTDLVNRAHAEGIFKSGTLTSTGGDTRECIWKSVSRVEHGVSGQNTPMQLAQFGAGFNAELVD